LRDQGREPGRRGRAAAPRARGAAAGCSARVRRGGHHGREAILRAIRVRRVRKLWGGAPVNINGVTIADTFAEAFTMRVARLVITGRQAKWAWEARTRPTRCAASVIGV